MGKNLFIAEKPSVAREFAKALQITGNNRDGYIESNDFSTLGSSLTMLFFKAFPFFLFAIYIFFLFSI